MKWCVVLLMLVVAAPVQAKHDRKSFDAPESAVQDSDSGLIYVSNVGGAPDAKDGNGFIAKLKSDGTLAEMHFLPANGEPALNAPKGLAIAGNLLWVTDLDRVVGFDPKKRKQVKEYSLTKLGVHFANDLVAASDHVLYVSDTAADQVISIDLTKDDGGPEVILKGATGGANGLAIEKDSGDLLIAASPSDFKTKAVGWRVHTVPGTQYHQLSPLPFQAGIGDGIASVGTAIYLSDWATGSIYKSDKGGAPVAVYSGLKGPADFGITTDGKNIIIVDMVASTVEIKPLK